RALGRDKRHADVPADRRPAAARGPPGPGMTLLSQLAAPSAIVSTVTTSTRRASSNAPSPPRPLTGAGPSPGYARDRSAPRRSAPAVRDTGPRPPGRDDLLRVSRSPGPARR